MCFSRRSKQLQLVTALDKGGDLRTAGSPSARASASGRAPRATLPTDQADRRARDDRSAGENQPRNRV